MAAAKAFGFFFHRRNHTSVLVREPGGGGRAGGDDAVRAPDEATPRILRCFQTLSNTLTQ